MTEPFSDFKRDLAACTLCTERFAQTKTRHSPRPVVWFDKDARILIAGQAPGLKVHTSGVPFQDPSGDRLRDWMGISKEDFYDSTLLSIVPMSFCFPGYSAKGADLPPPPVCADTWRTRVLNHVGQVRLTLLVGGYAQNWHLGKDKARTVSATVQNWRHYGPHTIPLPHPSWRNTAWLKTNPWFEADLLPMLRKQVQEALS